MFVTSDDPEPVTNTSRRRTTIAAWVLIGLGVCNTAIRVVQGDALGPRELANVGLIAFGVLGLALVKRRR